LFEFDRNGSFLKVLYLSNSNPPTDIDTAGEISKMRLDGTTIGKFRVQKVMMK
jgi:hypothetical protein